MTNGNKLTLGISLAATLGMSACGSSDGAPRTQEEMVARAMQQSLQGDLTQLRDAAKEMQAAAPAPTGRGWDKDMDAQALAKLKTAWMKARDAYEHVEGATAPIYPDLDVAMDERYDGFLAALDPVKYPDGDQNLFDDQGVTGMHAIERILYADVTPATIVTFEKTLPGYVAAAWPATEAEAAAFKDKLCAKLVADAQKLLDGWKPQDIDISGAFQGLVGLMNEQQEKVNKAASGEEESRYSQRTMADLRSNLAGTTKIYELFRAWLKSKPATGGMPSGTDVDASVTAGLADLKAFYASVEGDAIPQPPATWSAENPKPEDLQTPFGMLYEKIHHAVDPKTDGSLVVEMNSGATLLGIPVFTE
jgi:iron uptake system component EfeO